MLINVEMSTIVGIVTFMSMISFMPLLVEHEKYFITSGRDVFLHSQDISQSNMNSTNTNKSDI